MGTKKIILGILSLVFIASVFTASVFARRNYLGKYRPQVTPTSTPIDAPTGKPILTTITPSPTRTPRPTPTPTKSPSPVNTLRPTNLPTLTSAITPKPTSSGDSISVYITYYGWNDNDPPGDEIAYPKSESQSSVHSIAGGVGTFSDPVTFAADPKIFPPGTRIYVPYIKKYILMEDSCTACSGTEHIDIWAGGNGQNGSRLISCEEILTGDSDMVKIDPSDGLEVDTTPIFDSTTATCIN